MDSLSETVTKLREEKGLPLRTVPAYLDIAHSIEQKIDRKVDLVEKGQLNDFAQKTAANHLLKIYG